MNPITDGAIALWLFTNVCFLGAVGAIATVADKQYFGISAIPTRAADQTGFEGRVNAGEVRAIMSLAYPQRYESIKNRFGSPYARDQWRDFYRIEGANNWIAIEYQGTTAVGWIISDGF